MSYGACRASRRTAGAREHQREREIRRRFRHLVGRIREHDAAPRQLADVEGVVARRDGRRRLEQRRRIEQVRRDLEHVAHDGVSGPERFDERAAIPVVDPGKPGDIEVFAQALDDVL
jgi:hypothetical protein